MTLTNRIEFAVEGVPKPQPRPRAYRRGDFIGLYNPPDADVWRHTINQAGREYVPSEPMEGPLRVGMLFVMPRPKSHLKANGELKPSSPAIPTTKPDIDNLIKAVLDEMTKMKFWLDDKQVAVIQANKIYEGESKRGLIVNVREIPNP